MCSEWDGQNGKPETDYLQQTEAGLHHGDSTRADTILHAALALFVQHGYRGTSVSRIAEAAGIAKGTTYLYFPSKRAIFEALSDRLIERVTAQLDHTAQLPLPPEERVVRLFEIRFCDLFDWTFESPFADELIETHRSLDGRALALFVETFERHVRNGLSECAEAGTLDLDHHGTNIEGVMTLLELGARGAAYTLQEAGDYRKQLTSMLQALLRGFRPA